MAKPDRPRKDAPARPARPPARAPRLKVDEERFPALPEHPELERALRIRQAMLQGLPRDEAVQLAEQAMGERAPQMQSVPKPRPAKPAKAAQPTRRA